MARTAGIAAALLIACALTACQRSMLNPPQRVVSYCKPGTTLDERRLRAVAAAIEDGQRFKGAARIFERGVLPDLNTFGGAVAYWKPDDLHLPVYRAYYRQPHFAFHPVTGVTGAIAIVDTEGRGNAGPGNRDRFVYIALSISHPTGTVWMLSDSTDVDQVCH